MNVFRPMDIVSCNEINKHFSIGVIVLGPLDIPLFEDGCASEFSFCPLDIDNPKEWLQTFEAYIVYDLSKGDYVICSSSYLHKIERNKNSGFIPFDNGTGIMRRALGLIKFADKLYGKEYLKDLLSKGIEYSDEKSLDKDTESEEND